MALYGFLRGIPDSIVLIRQHELPVSGSKAPPICDLSSLAPPICSLSYFSLQASKCVVICPTGTLVNPAFSHLSTGSPNSSIPSPFSLWSISSSSSHCGFPFTLPSKPVLILSPGQVVLTDTLSVPRTPPLLGIFFSAGKGA